MSSQWMRRYARPLLAAVAILMAGAYAFHELTGGFNAFTAEAARREAVLAAPPAVPDAWGHDQTGRLLQLAADPLAEAGAGRAPRITIVDFVYTRCTTLCSTLGATYQQLQAQIVAAGLQDRVRLLTVSFDPAHDTPAVIADYAQRLHAEPAVWTVLTLADPRQLPALLRTFGVVVIPAPQQEFQHNAALHLLNVHGRLVRIVDIDRPAAALAAAAALANARVTSSAVLT